jgi:hypothetical protein
MIQIRKLTINDWDLVESKIRTSKNFNIAQTKESIGLESYLSYTLESFQASTRDTIVGYFENNELISMTSFYNFKIMPAYLFKNFKHFKETNLYNPLTNGFAPTMNKIIELQEQQHCYTFYVVKTANHKRLNQKRLRSLMFDEGCPKLKNYIISVEELVPGGTQSKYQFHYEGMYFKHILQEDTVVLRFTLPQEFRLNASAALTEKLVSK